MPRANEDEDTGVSEEMVAKLGEALNFPVDDEPGDTGTDDPADPGLPGDAPAAAPGDSGGQPAAGSDGPAATPGTGAETTVAPGAGAPAADPVPDTWKPEIVSAHWATLAPEVRSEIMRREDDIRRGFEAIAGLREAAGFAQRVSQVLAPHLPDMEAAGMDPLEGVRNMLTVHRYLRTAPLEAKIQTFRNFASDYGIDLTQLGVAAPPPGDQPSPVEGLRSELQEVKTTLQRREQAEREARLAESQRRINEFKVSRPHYDKVVGIMTNLIRAGQAQDLEDSYEQAILLHPETKQEVIREQVEAQRKAEAEAAKAEADRIAAQAKRDRRATSTNVSATNTQRGGGAARPTTGTVDDTLRATLDAIRGRDG